MKKLSPKNLLFVGRNWSTMGANNTFENLLKFFPEAISVTSKDIRGFDNRFYRYLKNKTGNSCYSSLSVALELNALKKALGSNIEIIHYWFGDHDYYYGFLFKKIFDSKIIINLFFSLEELERRMPNKQHLKKADLITCSGKAQLDYLSTFINSNRLAYLPLGIDTKSFRPVNGKNNRDKNLVICVGNNRRDYITLKKIYLILKENRPNIKLKLVGSLNAKDNFKNHPEVEILPFLSEKKFRDLYNKASILILPLLEGGSSQTLNEALSSGLPVITNSFPNLSDYTNTNGVLSFQPKDFRKMAHACLDLLDDEKRINSMSKSARLHMLNYDNSIIKEKLIGIYKSYLGIKINEGT
tara:strand:+ start:423 stop:1487 length:1065 start_codon:yes stop_codon:yes gene_type:complete